MVQRNGGSRHHGRNDPTEPVRRKFERPPTSGPTMQSFMDSFLSPFVQCVAPPFQTCVASSTPWEPRQARAASPINTVTPPVASPQPQYTTHHFGENDILCGKGRSSICHTGNTRFREIVEANKSGYAVATKKQKLFLAHSIVDLIRHANPPGRFLLRDLETGRWYDIGKNRSLEKTSQALREKPQKTSDAAANGSDERTSNGVPAKPSLVIPRHLRHIYQAPLAAEFRNPPHTQHVMGGHPGMYMYPLPSGSSFEMISPCNSGLSDGMHTASTHSMTTVTNSPVMAVYPPQKPRQFYKTPEQGSCRAASPQDPPPSSVYTSSPDSPPLASSPREALSSPPSQNIFRESSPTWKSPTMFSTPVDGYREMIPPSTVRRSRRQESGEDGQAALAAAAFLNLDDIE